MNRAETQAILERIGRLERENRTLRRGWLAFLFVSAAVVLACRARPSSVVEASKFVLKDAGGATRAELMMSGGAPVLDLRDSGGSPQVMLTGGDISGLTLVPRGGPGVYVFANSNGRTSGVTVGGEKGEGRVDLISSGESASLELMRKGEQPGVVLSASSGLTGVQVVDESGFEANLGTAELEKPGTGRTEKTSAASVILFGKDGKVLWSAP